MFDKDAFIDFVKKEELLKFGNFITKSGRPTTFFFNVGTVFRGPVLKKLGQFYASYIVDNDLQDAIIFGPAYKGISLSLATSIALADMGMDVAFSYNRKEVKDYGEGGEVIGANPIGPVLLIDDVVTSGMSILQSKEFVERMGGHIIGGVVALDRKEAYLHDERLAKTALEQDYSLFVYSMIEIEDIR